MSKRYERYYACERKRRYTTEADAARHARSYEHYKMGAFDAYACRFCGGWHLATHKESNHAYQSRTEHAIAA